MGRFFFKLGQCCFKVAQIRGERHFLGARGCRFWEIFFADNFARKTALEDNWKFSQTLVARNQKTLKRIGSSKTTIYRTHAEEKFVCKACHSVWSCGPENTFNTKKQPLSNMHQYHSDNKKCGECSKGT